MTTMTELQIKFAKDCANGTLDITKPLDYNLLSFESDRVDVGWTCDRNMRDISYCKNVIQAMIGGHTHIFNYLLENLNQSDKDAIYSKLACDTDLIKNHGTQFIDVYRDIVKNYGDYQTYPAGALYYEPGNLDIVEVLIEEWVFGEKSYIDKLKHLNHLKRHINDNNKYEKYKMRLFKLEVEELLEPVLKEYDYEYSCRVLIKFDDDSGTDSDDNN